MAEIRQIQVDGVNYDLVISEDEVSATAAAQSAAQALAYKNQAQSSAAQAGQQATNASNQADRAEDAASRAEQIVGGEFLSYGGDQGLDFDQQDQARENIGKATFKSMNGHSVVVEHAANIPLRSLVANIVPIQYGTGDPSPSNVRSIDGWTRLRTFTAVANLYDGKYEAGYYNSTTAEPTAGGTYYRNTSFIAIHPLTDNYISIPVYRYYYDENHNFLYRDPTGDAVATSPAGAYYMRFFQAQSSWTTNIMVCESSEAVAYTAFTPSYEITFPSLAGTVYGGTLNVKTGVLTVTRSITDMGDLYYNKYTTSGGNWFFWLAPPTNMKLNANMISTAYKNVGYQTDAQAADGQDYAISYNGVGTQLNIKNTSYSDASAFKAAMAGVKIVHDLTIPITYQCTPTEVTALLGLNNIWADTGDVSLQYLEQGMLTEEYAKYAEERIPQIATKMFSNRNLLDNPWFTVNQRNFTTSTGVNNIYSVDRWYIARGTGTISKTSNGITINGVGASRETTFQQMIDCGDLTGRTVTLSVNDGGTIRQITGTVPARTTSNNIFIRFTLRDGVSAFLYAMATSSAYAYMFQLQVNAGYTLDLRAVKLELGSVSTLANDAPPEYETELLKCQYYAAPLEYTTYSNPFTGLATSATEFFVEAYLPRSMREISNPTISVTGTAYAIRGGSTGAITSWEAGAIKGNHIRLKGVTTNLTTNTQVPVYTAGQTIKIFVSADI